MPDVNIPVAPCYRAAIRVALLQQVPWAIVCVLLLDFGRIARVCGIAMLAFWVTAFTIMARRPLAPTRLDMAFIRWGFFPLFALAFVAAATVEHMVFRV